MKNTKSLKMPKCMYIIGNKPLGILKDKVLHTKVKHETNNAY